MDDVPTGNTYDKYASSNPVERRLLAGFFKALDALLPATTPSRVLEVGAGEGHVAARIRQRYPSARVVTFDLPDPELARGWDASSGVFGSADALPFPDGAFDLVLAIEVLEHLPWPSTAVAELSRVCGGTVVASVPREPLWRVLNLARGKYVRALGNTPGHIQHWSKGRFRALLAERLDIESLRTPTPWTMASGRPRPNWG